MDLVYPATGVLTMPMTPQPPYVLGIDAGGTKTVCVLADANGDPVAQSRGDGANLQAAGELSVEKTLHQVMEGAIGDRPIVPAAICLGMAGVDRAGDATVVDAIMRRIGYKAKVLVTNDALVALVAGAGLGPGVVIIAGTGSIAYGKNADDEAVRAGGWGYVLGDEGSGYWLGRLALRAVVRESDGRGRPTSLTPRILAHFGVTKPQELIHKIYHEQIAPSGIAAVARYVQHARDEGDAIAVALLENAARELLLCAGSVVQRLRMQSDAFPFVLAGGIFKAAPWLAEALTQRLSQLAPHSTVTRLEREPALGAVTLALGAATGSLRVPAYLLHR